MMKTLKTLALSALVLVAAIAPAAAWLPKNAVVDTNSTQTISGAKTFGAAMAANSSITINNGASLLFVGGTQAAPVSLKNSADNSAVTVQAGSSAGIYSKITMRGNWNGTSAAGGFMDFYTKGLERARITEDGEILVATTTDGGAEKIQVNGGISATSLKVGAASILAGTGTPEGLQTAPVGSLFLRTDGGAATTLYVKESGTGNTGWVAK